MFKGYPGGRFERTNLGVRERKVLRVNFSAFHQETAAGGRNSDCGFERAGFEGHQSGQ